jgi:hypothetical protein
VPQALSDLTDPAYADMLVVQNPATSSPGLAFLLLTAVAFGTEGEYTYLDFWTDLVANGVLVTQGWSDAYFGHFTAGSEDGTYPLVVSYASSPPFTYDEDLDDVTTSSIVADNTCFRQIEFARHSGRDGESRGRAAVHRLHAERAFPGRYAAADVCLSGESECRAAGAVRAVRSDPRYAGPDGTRSRSRWTAKP